MSSDTTVAETNPRKATRPTRRDAEARAKSIGLFFDNRLARDEEFLRGIFAYARESKVAWEFHHADNGEIADDRPGRQIALDGMVIGSFDPRWEQAIVMGQKRGTPGVIMTIPTSGSGLGGVTPDDRAIGRIAAEHFLQRGFQSFGYCGYADYWYSFSVGRHEGFRRTLGEAGHQAQAYWFPHPEDNGLSAADRAGLESWLAALPKPVAIMAVMDDRARQVSLSCRRLRLRVPEDVAICGSDDRAVCQTDLPFLSSVQLNRPLSGYTAARLLDRMMQGEPAPAEPMTVAPRGVVVRQSSDIFAVADADVQLAVRWIYDHAHRPLRVDQVVEAAMISRTGLEQKFRRALGRTIQEEIWQAHVERAKRLLIESDDDLSVVARESGFKNSFRLCHVFRQRTGKSPGEYRQANRAGRL